MNALTARFYRGQLGLKAQVVRDSARIWRTWRGTSKDEWNQMVDLAFPLVASRHQVSAGAAARYFETLSAVETGRRHHGELGPSLTTEYVGATLAVTALTSVYNGRQRGLSLDAAKQVGFVRFSGALSRLALNGGRDAILASVQHSRQATGWQRITSGDPCGFCAGLAGDPSSAEAFQSHDHCSCVAEPTF